MRNRFVWALLFWFVMMGLGWAQPAPIADSFARHRSVLSCPGSGGRHDYEQCAFEFMRRVACDHRDTIALWPKTGGTFCTHNGRGYDCDKLVVLADGEMYDIVSGAGAASQSPAWLLAQTGVFSGTVPPPSCPAMPVETVDIATAVVHLHEAFQVRTDREWSELELQMLAAHARSVGWDGGPRITVSIVDQLHTLIARYSGDITNPFPAVDPNDAFRQIAEAFSAKFARGLHPIELTHLANEARARGYAGGMVPQWLVEELLALVDAYDGSLAPEPIDPLSEFTIVGREFHLDGQPFEWKGTTAFLLFYDYVHRQAQYRAFRDAMVAARQNVVRVSVATPTGYLLLTPRSGGTFGLGHTAALYPGSIPDFWGSYRAMLHDLANFGIVAEVVPFLTAGPPHTRNGQPTQGDDSIPQMQTAALRMAYAQETARELLPIRAKFYEMANEYNHIGFALDGLEVLALWNAVKAVDPTALVARSAPYDGLGLGSLPASRVMVQGDYATLRISRKTTPVSWQWIIDKVDIPKLPYQGPAVDDEGINADSVGEFGNDPTPANHWANCAFMRLAPGLSYTFHFDRALKGLAPSTVDGSAQALAACTAGRNVVPSNVHGAYLAYRRVLGADAAVARLDDSEGWLLLLGASESVDVPEWEEALVDARGPHRLYRLTRIVH